MPAPRMSNWSRTTARVGCSSALPTSIFFFQAEDGIRDHCVTGVQTCALPIFLPDGPRVLGLQDFDRTASKIRLQVRTAPTRQDEVARELRRRIQTELLKQGITVSSVQRIELTGVSHSSQEAAQPDSAN